MALRRCQKLDGLTGKSPFHHHPESVNQRTTNVPRLQNRYPLLNVYTTMERSTMFNGKFHCFSAILHCDVTYSQSFFLKSPVTFTIFSMETATGPRILYLPRLSKLNPNETHHVCCINPYKKSLWISTPKNIPIFAGFGFGKSSHQALLPAFIPSVLRANHHYGGRLKT